MLNMTTNLIVTIHAMRHSSDRKVVNMAEVEATFGTVNAFLVRNVTL